MNAISDSLSTQRSALDPINRSSEILFGLIMVLSFTCSLSATGSVRDDVREMLLAALGCNVAWGIIDAFFYLMSAAAESGREFLMVEKLKSIDNPDSTHSILQEIIPDLVLSSIPASAMQKLRESMIANHESKANNPFSLEDLRGAFIVFALVFLSTFPVAAPFLIFKDLFTAIRVSNLIALLLLFSIGYSLGHYSGRRAWLWGAVVMIIGVILVSITIALGG